MGRVNGLRTRKGGRGDGAVASLLISPRDYHYTVCGGGHRLYYTNVGEKCPLDGCGVLVSQFVDGDVPQQDGGLAATEAQIRRAFDELRRHRGPFSTYPYRYDGWVFVGQRSKQLGGHAAKPHVLEYPLPRDTAARLLAMLNDNGHGSRK